MSEDDLVTCIECGEIIVNPDNDITTVCGGSVHPSCLIRHMSHCRECQDNDNLMTLVEFGDLSD